MATDLPTPQELATIAQQKLRSLLDPGGTGAVNLNPGSRNDTMISTASALASRSNQYTGDRATARSLSTATGDDLDALVNDIYQDTRKQSAPATGTLYLQRTGTAATIIPNGTRFAVPAVGTTPGVVFICSQDTSVAMNAGQPGSPISVPITCTQNGIIGNVLISTITSIVDALGDTTWAVAALPAGAFTNTAGGAELETDDIFRARIQQSAFDDSKKRGTKKAIQTGANQVLGVNATATTVVEPGDGTVLVYVGDAGYNLSSALQTAVQANLESWRAFGVPALVRPFTVITVTITATINMQRPLNNYNSQAIQAQAFTNLSNYFNNRQRPDEFYGSAITAALSAASPEVQQVILNSVTTSANPQPDTTNSVRRPADALYGAVTQMPRYVISSASVQINLAPPVTQ